MHRAPGGHFRDGLDEAAGLGDLVERAFQCRPGDAPTAVIRQSGIGGASLSYMRRCLMFESSAGLPYWHQPCDSTSPATHFASAVAAIRWASSCGLLIIGQWPESISTNPRCLALAHSGTSPASIHSRA